MIGSLEAQPYLPLISLVNLYHVGRYLHFSVRHHLPPKRSIVTQCAGNIDALPVRCVIIARTRVTIGHCVIQVRHSWPLKYFILNLEFHMDLEILVEFVAAFNGTSVNTRM